MRNAMLIVAAALVGAFALTPVCQAGTVYSEDFLLFGDLEGNSNLNSNCPASQAPGHSAPDVLRIGDVIGGDYLPVCEGSLLSGAAATPPITTDGTCSLSFNYFLASTEWEPGTSFAVTANDEVLVSSSAGSLANSATWTAIEALALPAGGVVIEFISNTPYMPGGFGELGRGFLVDDLAVVCPGGDDPVYSEDFGLSFEFDNSQAVTGWAHNASCQESREPGHSTPGVLRWGNFRDCWLGSSLDSPVSSTASTPSFSTTDDCSLSFDYLLDCCTEVTTCSGDTCHTGVHCGDCDGTLEVRANDTVLASYEDGLLVNNGTWAAVDGLELPPGELVVEFVASARSHVYEGPRWYRSEIPAGPGWFIDDIRVQCPDEDGDGILDGSDLCPGTAIPESIPTRHLGVNRWALVDDDDVFDTTPPPGGGGGPEFEFSLTDTRGCSCEQIIEAMALGWGHTKFGCSTGALLTWIAMVWNTGSGGSTINAAHTEGLTNRDLAAGTESASETNHTHDRGDQSLPPRKDSQTMRDSQLREQGRRRYDP